MSSNRNETQYANDVQSVTKASGRRWSKPTTVVAFICACAFVVLLARNFGLNPAIFADEWYYSRMARLIPLRDAILPSYLYFWIFRASNACGDGFFDCVRLGNELLYVGAAPFIYLVARRVTGAWIAVLIAALALLAPVNMYTALFMPEPTYFFGFAVLSWVVLNCSHWNRAVHGLAAGAVLGLMSLVKVHALFLVPALCLFLVCAGALRQEPRWLRGGLAAAVLAVLGTLGVKFGLGWLLAGETALSVFGSFYASSATTSVHRSLSTFLAPAFINGRGHLEAVSLLLTLPLAMLAYSLLSRAMRNRLDPLSKQVQLYIFLMLGSAMGMTISYTASIAGWGPGEILRLHLRYYSFTFPFMLIVAAMPLRADGKFTDGLADTKDRAVRWAIALLVAAVILFALVKLPTYVLNIVDGPESASLKLDTVPGKIVALLDLAVLAVWASGRQRAASWLFLLVAVPMMTIMGTSSTTRYLHGLATSYESDKAGKFAHQYLPPNERNQVTIAASDAAEIMRVQFHVDAPDTAMLELAPNAPVVSYQVPMKNKWLLVVGKHALPEGLTPVVATSDYALVRTHTDLRILGKADMSQPWGSGIVVDAQGMSAAEGWGRWSDAKQVVLHFAQPLPRNAYIGMKIRTFADNANQVIKLHVGGETLEFKVAGSEQEVGLRVQTDGTVREVSFDVPHPVSPLELGMSVDSRKLGIGIAEMTIATPAE